MIPAKLARVLRFAPWLVLLALTGCSPEGKPNAPRSDTGIELFVPPRKSLYVEPGMPLTELLERYTERMGWSLLVPEGMREKLAARHCGFTQRLEVPFGSVHGFVEALVRSNGFFLRFEHGSEPVVLQVVDPDDKEVGDIPAHRVLVPLAEVPRWEVHPAHMISAQAPLPAGDPKDLVASLRAVFGETARGVVLQAGETNTILFSGTGAEVARLVRVLGDVTRGAAAPAAFPPQLERTRWIELLRTPEKGMQLEEKDWSKIGLPLKTVVEQYAQRMGWQLYLDEDVQHQLELARLSTHLPLDVPPENVHTFVEGVLRANNFLLEFVHASEPVLLRVTVAEGRGERLRTNAMEVAADELPRWVAHTDFLIRTKLNLPGVDVRTLSNGLRALFSDNQRQQILPIGTDGMIVTGYASEVARIAQLFRTLVDEAAGAKPGLPPAVPEATDLAVLANPAEGLHLAKPERDEARLIDLVEVYAQHMGWELLMDSETRNQLRVLKCGMALPVDVPAERVHAFVQGILKVNDFVLSFATTESPVLLNVQSTNSPGRGNPRKSACFVRPADIPRWSAHPDFLITTVVDLPSVDVRTLSNSLRQMFSDQQTQQIIPLGNSDSLLITGFADEVGSLTTMFRTLVDAAAGAHATPPAPVAAPRWLELLAAPAGPLQFEKPEESDVTLAQFVAAYAQCMGWRVLLSQEARSLLQNLKCGFTLPVEIPAAHVHAFVEGVLRANGFMLTFAHAEEPVLLSIHSLNSPGRGNPRQDALMVPASSLPHWAAHPGFLLTTLVDLPGVDVRTLSNSLRQMFSDQQTQQIIPVGNSDGLILTGFGSDVAAIASTLGTLADAARGAHTALAQPVQIDSGIGLFVAPSKGLHLEKNSKGELKLDTILKQYGQLMDWRILAGPEDWAQFRHTDCAPDLPLDVPAKDVQAFVEGIARANEIVFTFASTRQPVLLRVMRINNPGKGNPRANAISVRAVELPHWAEHRAFLVSTMVDLPGLDVRVLSNSLRQKYSDQETQQVVPLGNSDGLILTGFADEIAELAGSLAEESRKALADRPPTAPATPAAERARLFPQPAADLAFDSPYGDVITSLALLEAFAKWSQRPLEISEEARSALGHPAFPPQTLRAELVYPCISVQLDHVGCTLLPFPASAPVKWVIDVAGKPREELPTDWPRIALEDLTSWGAYSATPFRTELQLPVATDPERVNHVFELLKPSRSRGLYDMGHDRVVLLWGTPREIQTAAGMIREACEPLPAGGR